MNEDLWREYLQNYYAQMRTRLTDVDTFYNVTTGTLTRGTGNYSLAYSFSTWADCNNNESVEKFIK